LHLPTKIAVKMAWSDILARGIAVLAVGLACAIVAYVGVSFLVMRAHTEARPLRVTLREALREAAWVTLTQPLVPLYYVIGRRMGGRADGVPIVLVHGYSQNRVDFLRIARTLARASLGPIYGFNYAWFASARRSTAHLAAFIARVQRETGAPHVDLVAHSLGGVIASEYAHGEGASHVRRLVTIAAPHAGLAWRGPIIGAVGPELRRGGKLVLERAARRFTVPCLSLYSTHDNIVYPPATSELVHRGGRDHVVANVGHLSILFDLQVASAIVDFLRAPEADIRPPAV
jgi:pimeloyl-ACP methyl ester carboxylesterase